MNDRRNSRHEHQIIPRRPLGMSPVGAMPMGLQGVSYIDEGVPSIPVGESSDSDEFAPTVPKGATFWVTIAASDAPEAWRASADFVCDGLTDAATILEARDYILGLSYNTGYLDEPSSISNRTYGLLFSSGTFALEQRLVLYGISEIKGAQKGATLLYRNFSDSSFSTVAINAISSDVGSYVNSDPTIVSNIVFNGNSIALKDAGMIYSPDLVTSGGRHIIYRDCAFVNSSDVGLYTSFSDRTEVYDCNFEYCPIGIYTIGSADNETIIDSCTFGYNETSIYTGLMATIKNSRFQYDGNYSGGDRPTPVSTFGRMGIVSDTDVCKVIDCLFLFNEYIEGCIVSYDNHIEVIGCFFYDSNTVGQKHFINIQRNYRGLIDRCSFQASTNVIGGSVIYLESPYDTMISNCHMFAGDSIAEMYAIHITDDGYGDYYPELMITIKDSSIYGRVGQTAIKADTKVTVVTSNMNIVDFDTDYDFSFGAVYRPSQFYSGIEVPRHGEGIYLYSPNGQRFKLTIDNSGILQTAGNDAFISLGVIASMTASGIGVAVATASINSTASTVTLSTAISSGLIDIAGAASFTGDGVASPTVTINGIAGLSASGSVTTNGQAAMNSAGALSADGVVVP